MRNKELYTELTEAYSQENLNRITGKLILLYKKKNYATIRAIANKISNYVNIDEKKDAKCFSKLVVLYHPDKGYAIREEIKQLYEQNKFDVLQKFAHIRFVQDIENLAIKEVDESIDYQPEYVWDTETEEIHNTVTEVDEDAYLDNQDEIETERSFFNLIKIREYSRTNIELPTYYLEDFEEFELAESGLESLDGVEYCSHVKILDVSNNALTDISNLWELHELEELYLANNQIGYIDALSNLSKLRIVDLSGNEIDDISPLFELENLEYVNLVRNPIPKNQLTELEKNGCVVAN
ncbi:leucine-rich repeat domain-containing protein [uncultured Draconibacterium sp.]|uniref:leucine-rich repeat domain-containing protein n=1 Tax=uncultured Draconibacterium sp. TaxID=1573823 RepID=UPI002AA6CA02|nr:leucine-rich repeat domain-containing protein [uncultured Draconibacterium sp.]